MNVNKIASLDSIRAVGLNGSKRTDSETISNRSVKTVTDVDKVELSTTASEVGRLIDRVKELPDPGIEKVSSLREQIAIGTYDPPSEDIADAILNRET